VVNLRSRDPSGHAGMEWLKKKSWGFGIFWSNPSYPSCLGLHWSKGLNIVWLDQEPIHKDWVALCVNNESPWYIEACVTQELNCRVLQPPCNHSGREPEETVVVLPTDLAPTSSASGEVVTITDNHSRAQSYEPKWFTSSVLFIY